MVGVAEVVAVTVAAAVVAVDAAAAAAAAVATRHAAAIADDDIDGVERGIVGMDLARMGSAKVDIEVVGVVAIAVVAVGNDALAAATGMLVGERNEVVVSVDMKSVEFEVAAAIGAAMDIATVENMAVVVGIVPAAAPANNVGPERYIALAVVASDTDYDGQDVATVLATATAAAVVAAAGVVD